MIRVSIQKTVLNEPHFYTRGENEVLLSDLVEEYFHGVPKDLILCVVGEQAVDYTQFANTMIENGDVVYLSIRQEVEATTAWLILSLLTSAYLGYQMYKMEIPDLGEGANEKQARINGMRNGPRLYERIPVVLGTHRVAPDWLAEPYVEVVGEDQYYNLLLCGGYAPQKLEDFRIGDTNITEYEDVSVVFSSGDGVQETVDSNETGSVLVRSVATPESFILRRAWPNDVTQESVNVELATDAPVVRTTAGSVASVSLDFNLPTGLIAYTGPSGKRRHTATWLNIELEEGSGDAYKLAKVIDFTTEFGILNFNGLTRYNAHTGDVYHNVVDGKMYLCEFGYGTAGRLIDIIDFFNGGEGSLRGNQIPTSARVREIPAEHIVRHDVKNGTVSVSTDWEYSDGVHYAIADRSTRPRRVSVKHDAYDDDTLNTYDVSVGLILPTNAEDEDRKDKISNTIAWDFLTGFSPIDESGWTKLIGGNRPLRDAGGETKVQTFKPVVVAVRIKASNQLSGMLDRFNYNATSMVPTNWSSDWRNLVNLSAANLKTTDNPADVYRLFLQGPFNPFALPNSKIDLDALEDWRDFCDLGGGEVEDGLDPFRISGYLREASILRDELFKVAFTGRAIPLFTNDLGKHSVSVKRQQTVPVQMFTPKNSRGFSSNRAFPEDVDGLKFEFRNEEIGYEQDEGTFVDPDKTDAQLRGIFTSVDIPYVSDPELAYRHARFAYFENRLRREVYSLEADIEALKCTRGDLVRIQNDIIDVGLNSGRVTAASGGTFFLDETDQLEVGVTYATSIRTVESIHTGTARYEGGNEWLVISGDNPVVGDLLAYGTTTLLDCIVTGVSNGPNLTSKLELVNHAPELFDVDSGAIPEYETNLTPRLEYKTPAAPTLIVPTEPADLVGGLARVRFISNARQDSPARFYSLEARSTIIPSEDAGADGIVVADPWRVVGVSSADEGFVDLQLGLDNFFQVRGRSLGANGLYSEYSEIHDLMIPQGPSDVVDAVILQELINTPKTPDANLSTIVVRITPPDDPFYNHAVVRYRKVGQFDFLTAGRVGAVENNRIDIVVPSNGTEYEITANSVSHAGVEGEEFVSETITVYDVRNDPVVPEIEIPNVKGLEIFNQGNDTEFVGTDVEFNWLKTSLNEWTPIGSEPGKGLDYGGLDQYFKDYEIRIFDSSNNELSRHYTAINTFTYTYEQNRQDFFKLNGEEGANRTIRADVRMRGRNNQLSKKAAKLTVSNPAPTLPVLFPSVSFTHVSFSYTAPSDRDFKGLKLWLSTTDGFTPNDDINLVHPLGYDTSISVDGLDTGTTYYVVYQAFDEFGEGPVSDQFSFTTNKVTSADLDDEPPTVPTNLTLSTGVEESALLTRSWVLAEWEASTDDGIVTGYFVTYEDDEGEEPITIFTGATSFRITDAVPGREYTFRVRAQDWAGNVSADSDPESIAAAGDTDAPDVPTSVTASAGLDKVILNWINPTDDDFLAVRVHRSITNGFTAGAGNILTTMPGKKGESVEVVDADVVNGTPYYYRVVALDVTGNASAPSSQQTATPFRISDTNISNYFSSAAIGDAYIDNLDAVKITAGDIAADRMAANFLTVAQAEVNELSAIKADLGTITAGTLTGTLIRTADSGARVELNSSDGVIGRNSSADVTFQLDTDGSGFLGVTNSISWDTAGVVTIPGTLIAGEIVGNTIKTKETGWRVELSDSATPFRYWDGTTTRVSFDDAGNASFVGTVTIGSGSSGIANLSDAGALATENSADWSTQVSGSGKPSDNADVTVTIIDGGLITTGGLQLDGTSAFIRAGKANYADTTAGFWLGRDSSVAKFKVGDASNFIDFNGSDLVLAVDKLGSGADNSGVNSVALGSGSEASGDNSISIGRDSEAFALDSIAIGRNASSPETSVVIGTNASAMNMQNVVIGNSAKSDGAGNVSIGLNADAGSGNASVAIGVDTLGATNSVCLGTSSRSFDTGVAIGYRAEAGDTLKSKSIAIGADASAKGASSIAIGVDSVANEDACVSIGVGAESESGSCVLIGEGSTIGASSANSVVIGKNISLALGHPRSVVIGDSAAGSRDGVSIGTGVSAGNEGVCIGSSASSSVGTVAIGFNAVAGEISTTAIGRDSSATVSNATSIGQSSTASGAAAVSLGVLSNSAAAGATAVGSEASSTNSFSTSLGFTSSATGVSSTSVGHSALSAATSATALGHSSSAAHTSSTALGHNATTTATNQIRLGVSASQVSIPGTLSLQGGAINVVGSYALCMWQNSSVVNPGDTVAGSDLRYARSDGGTVASPTPTGTWRCMGLTAASGSEARTTLWVKVA
jgi:fibronectin type 3 domain-containing protein